MGWTPTRNTGGESDSAQAPRRRRAVANPKPDDEVTPRTRRRRRAKAGGAAPELHARDEHITVSRPKPGNRAEPAETPVVKVQLGRRWSQIVTEIKRGDYTWRQFAEGLTAEELARGQLRDSKGGFTGRPPTIVPREFHLACFRELKRRFDEQFQQHVLDIAEQYVTLAQDPNLPVKDRAKMMQYAMERVFGGIPKEVLVKQDSPWESVVTSVIAEDGDAPADWRKGRYDEYMEEGSDDDEPER